MTSLPKKTQNNNYVGIIYMATCKLDDRKYVGLTTRR